MSLTGTERLFSWTNCAQRSNRSNYGSLALGQGTKSSFEFAAVDRHVSLSVRERSASCFCSVRRIQWMHNDA